MIHWTPEAHDAAEHLDTEAWWKLRGLTQDIALLTGRDEVDAETIDQGVN